MIHRFIDSFLSSGYTFLPKEQFLKFQFQFFNIMMALAFLISPIIALLHYILGFEFLFYSDMLFSLTAFFLIHFLRRDKSHFKLATRIFIPALFMTITLVFFLAGDDPTKVIWAPIFFACVFLLRGSKEGFIWLGAVLFSYFVGYLILSEKALYYKWQELGLISLSFITLSVIFNAFRAKNDADNDAWNLLNYSLEERITIALTESEDKTRTLEHNFNIINKHLLTISTDLKGNIIHISEAFVQTTGYPKSHFIDASFKILFNGATSLESFETQWSEKEVGTIFNFEAQCLNMKGEPYWLDMYIQEEFSRDNELVGYVCIAHNITNKKRVLIQQEQMLAQSRHAAMGEMIAMIAHQWRQPLTSISAITTNMQVDMDLENFPSNDTQNQIKRISHQVQHLSETIDNFRDFFKPTKEREHHYIHPLMEEAIALLSHRLTDDIEILYTQRSNIKLDLYHNEILQVFTNIINNACDAFKENNISHPKLWISEFEEGNNVMIKIQDNAGGVDPSILKDIFNPYFSTKAKNGTGLGLYMCKTIIEEHQNGSLSAYNENDGVSFCISLPINQN